MASERRARILNSFHSVSQPCVLKIAADKADRLIRAVHLDHRSDAANYVVRGTHFYAEDSVAGTPYPISVTISEPNSVPCLTKIWAAWRFWLPLSRFE